MFLREILQVKGTAVHTSTPDATLQDVVLTLVRNNCGSLVICERKGSDPGRMLGIITERDILRACAVHPCLDKVRVSEVMTAAVITGTPNDSVEDTMGLMTQRRIRHLPIVDPEGHLLGLVSIGDVVKAEHDHLTMENYYMRNYIQS